MSFLSMRDLSALMRTCRYFLDACAPSLCARSGALLHDTDLEGVPRLHRFLRIDSGPSSRAHLINELWISISGTQYQFDVDKIVGGTTRSQWSSAFLDILRHCHNLRRLRIDLWLDEDVPFPLLVDTISSLRRLEDLTLYLPRRLQDPEVEMLRKFAGLPLRRLAFLKYRETSPSLDHPLVPLEGLPRSLVELDIDLCMPVSRPFANVRTLGVRVPTSDTFVADATTAFPNATQLILRRHVEKDVFSSVSGGPGPLIQRARAHNKIQWQCRYREAWPSLSAVWAVNLGMLYAVGFSRQMSSLSIPLGNVGEWACLAPVLADTSPKFLEFRVAVDDLPFAPAADWRLQLGPAAASVQRLKFLFEMGDLGRLEGDDPTEGVFVSLCLLRGCRRADIDTMHRWTKDDICAMLPAFTSLTHMFIKFAAKKNLWEFECRPLDQYEAEAVEEAIETYLPRFEQECGSLQWVAFDVYNLDLECWEISHTGEGANGEGLRTRGGQGSWTKASREAGLEVWGREGMDAFKDVRPLPDVIRY